MAGARLRRNAVPAVVLVGLLAPLAITAIGQRAMRWTPVFDLAMIELRVRDAATGQWPLLGLVGRIGTAERLGSHPGPLSFYLLAPVYRLLGSTSWALEVSSLVFHGGAIVVAVLVARRRAGTAGAAAIGTVVAFVVVGYGRTLLSEPWNPYLPVLWFVVVLVATWSVVAGDRAMLPIAVFAGSICVQTHVPYLPAVVGLLGVAAAASVVRPRADVRALRWLGASVLVGAVLWAPPFIDQLVHDPGNLTILAEHFATPPEATIGLREGGRLLFEHLDLWNLVVDGAREPGQYVAIFPRRGPVPARGVAVAVAWSVAAGLALASPRLRRHRSLIALHLVCAASLALAWFAFGRIFGAPLYYLMLWGWSIAGLVGLATAWTVVELALGVQHWSAPSVRRQVLRAVALSGTVVVVSLGLRLATQPRPVELGLAPEGSQLGRLVPGTANGLEDAGGRRGRWLITWTDSAHLGSQGYGLVNELERRGFDVGVVPYHAVNFVPHRLVPEAEAAGRLHLVVGEAVEAWREVPGAQLLAYDDSRTSSERDQFERLRRELQAEMRATGLDDLAETFDDNLWVSSFDPRLDPLQSLRIQEMRNLGVPAAVFVVPVAAGI